jgi:hypothetical protein
MSSLHVGFEKDGLKKVKLKFPKHDIPKHDVFEAQEIKLIWNAIFKSLM